MVSGWVSLCSKFETWQRGCRRDGTKQVEYRVVSNHGGWCDEVPLGEEEKRLYQQIVAKAQLSSTRSIGLEVCNFMSCKCRLVALLWGHEGGETSWALPEESTRCLAGFPLSRPTTRRALVLHGCRQDFSEINQRVCRDSWWWSPQLLGEEAKKCCTVKLGKGTVRGHHVAHEIFRDPERVGSRIQMPV